MGYDIELKDPSGAPVQVDRHAEGGTYAVGGTTNAHVSITYNYAQIYARFKTPEPWIHHGEERDTFSIRWLYGRTGRETAPMLFAATQALGTQRVGSYWDANDGNAGYMLGVLLAWALQHPEAVWDGD